MDAAGKVWHKSDMDDPAKPIPAWQLYGETRAFPDLLHVERIVDRAAGLDWRIAPHRHIHLHQIFLLVSGAVAMTVDGAPLDAAPPVIINLPPGVAHGFRFAAGTDGYVLTLPASGFADLFGPGAETAPGLARPFAAPAPQDAAARFAAMLDEHGQRAVFRATRLRAAALDIGGMAARAAGAPDGAQAARGDPRVQRLAALIAERCRDGWTVADYARALALSPRHLSRLCRAETGQPAQAMIAAATIRAACSLLVYTRMTVAEVGYATGFDDPAYFSRAFRRHMGLSPGAYRARFDG
ncbi:MAG: helix-turn-helix domain-containing protein [Gemmobacter sp.]